MTLNDYIAQGRMCADKNNAIEGIRQLRTAAADCRTKEIDGNSRRRTPMSWGGKFNLLKWNQYITYLK